MAILKVKNTNGDIIDIPALQGLSAYQLAVNQGFDGTEEEWLESLKGNKGDSFTYEDFTPEQLAALKGKDGYTPQKGVDYVDGENGISPVVTISNITNGYKVSVTDVNGTAFMELTNGINGKTPEKGTDYWTQTDKQEIVDDVLAALPTWVGGSY